MAVPTLQLQSYRKMVYTGLKLAVAEWWDKWLRNILASHWWIQGVHWVHMDPLQKFKKNDFLASFEGFWTIKQFLDALHHLVWPSN